MKRISVFIFILFFLTQRGYSQYESPFYSDPALEDYVINHEKIAILPMDVTVRDVQPRVKKRLTPEEAYDLEMQYRLDYQHSMYSWLLRRQQKGKIDLEIQDVEATNALLDKNGIYTREDLASYRYDEIAALLGVDAVFSGRIITTTTFNRKAAIAWALILEENYTTGNADASLTLYDKMHGDRIWSYNNVLYSDYMSSPNALVNQMMKQVSRRFPY